MFSRWSFSCSICTFAALVTRGFRTAGTARVDGAPFVVAPPLPVPRVPPPRPLPRPRLDTPSALWFTVSTRPSRTRARTTYRSTVAFSPSGTSGPL